MIQEEGVKMEKLVERFLTYVKVNTRSDANSQTTDDGRSSGFSQND